MMRTKARMRKMREGGRNGGLTLRKLNALS